MPLPKYPILLTERLGEDVYTTLVEMAEDRRDGAVQMIESGWAVKDTATLVEARHLFARREYDHKYRWKPTAAILRQVGEAIFG